MEIFWTVLDIAAIVLRFLGLLVFGLGSSWLTLHVLGRATKTWQTEVAVLAVFLGLGWSMMRYPTGGALAAYTLGAGIGLIVWGVRHAMSDSKK
jgi:hypothetical protein